MSWEKFRGIPVLGSCKKQPAVVLLRGRGELGGGLCAPGGELERFNTFCVACSFWCCSKFKFNKCHKQDLQVGDGRRRLRVLCLRFCRGCLSVGLPVETGAS